jgi:phosphopantothenoylcysteine decarboxylase/phosphopantothenate--cysteine ligase
VSSGSPSGSTDGSPGGGSPGGAGRRLVITAGPTHEPIDAVRYLGNRSSGRLGLALASAAAGRGWRTTLLLGPVPADGLDTRVELVRFRTAADLEARLAEHAPRCDALVMAAAVADYRPRRVPGPGEKLRRSGDGLTLDLEPTPDLLAGLAASRRPGQVLVGFALEPRDRLEASARAKLERKGVDAIVANPLETMDAGAIEAWLIRASGDADHTGGAIPKEAFAGWLLARVEAMAGAVG